MIWTAFAIFVLIQSVTSLHQPINPIKGIVIYNNMDLLTTVDITNSKPHSPKSRTWPLNTVQDAIWPFHKSWSGNSQDPDGGGGVFGGGGASPREEMATPKFIQGSPHFIRVTTLGCPAPQKNSPPRHIFTQFEKQRFPKKYGIFSEKWRMQA